MDFKGKSVIITGGASGIGLLCGKNFAGEGAKVVLVDVDEKALDEAVSSIRREGGTVLSAVADVRDYSQIEKVRDTVLLEFGSIDILINCAGGASFRIHNRTEEFKDMPLWVLDWGIDVNLKGPLYFTRAVIGQMIEQKSGVIIYIGSITGHEGGNGHTADYSTAKSGVMNGLTKSIAQYGAPHGVRACCVSPGPVLTRPGMANMKTLLGRAAEPVEIVDFIMYLASDKAAFITGVNYLIDGGRSCLLN
jgi:NAD(P)-dependent dehydrogenase (short-subunit alcohol dehydrogenase family)